MENQQNINIVDEINYIKSLIDSIDSQINVLLRGLDELRRAVSVLKDQNLASSEETRISIGAGIYVNAKIDVTENILVPIGSDLYKEENVEKTVSRLDENIAEVEKSINNFSAQREELSRRYESMVSLLQREGQQKREKA